MKKVLTFDLGGTTVKYALIGQDLQLCEAGSMLTNTEDYSALRRGIFSVVDRLGRYAEGISLSLPGAVDVRTGMIYNSGAIGCLVAQPLCRELEEYSHLPTVLENDACCAALAEFYAGAAKERKNVVMIVLGTGIGGAVITNGRLLRTDNHFSGEFGYLILDYEKMLTWEELNGSVVSTIREVKKNGTPYTEMAGKEIFDLYKEDAWITEKVQHFYKMLACACYSVHTAFDPECIIIGGGISQRKDLIDNINEYMAKVCSQREISRHPKILTGKFLDTANLIGAYYNFYDYMKEKRIEIQR